MSLVQVREKAQITLPSKIRKALSIKEGDYLEAKVEDNKIVLIPKILIDKAKTLSPTRILPFIKSKACSKI